MAVVEFFNKNLLLLLPPSRGERSLQQPMLRSACLSMTREGVGTVSSFSISSSPLSLSVYTAAAWRYCTKIERPVSIFLSLSTPE